MNRSERLRALLSEHFGRDVGALTLRAAGGGCINQAATVHVADRDVFVKWNDRPLPAQFAAEAAGLRALRATGALRIPEVYAFDDGGPGRSFLAIERLSPGRRERDFDERLGHALAELHRVTHVDGFGFEVDGYCGATPQPNSFRSSWVEFYREQRLQHQLDLARPRGLGRSQVASIQRLVERLDRFLTDDEPPALIHGDLWSGNLFASDRGPALIDPAAYFAHREAELGMMVLFGGFSARTFAAYRERYPLRDGYEERLPLYSLYHALNHFNLFGGGYGEQAADIARRFVG